MPTHAQLARVVLLALLLLWPQSPAAEADATQDFGSGAVFSAKALDSPGAQGKLTLGPNFVTSRTLRWESSDARMGSIDTGFFQPSIWKLTPGQPARLIFKGSVGGQIVSGSLLFAPHNRGMIDVKRGGKRVRYLGTVASE